jgi:hypothetical protein
MSIFTIYGGDKGLAGVDGLNGLGVLDVDAEPVDNPLLSALFNNSLSVSALVTASRNSSAAYVDRYGVLGWARSPTITNYVQHSNDFTQWTDAFGRWSYIGATTDPFSGNDAAEINLDVDTDALGGTGFVLNGPFAIDIPAGTEITASFYIKIISGDVSGLDITIDPFATRFICLDPTDEWQRITYPTCITVDATAMNINPRGKTGARVAVYAAQAENGPAAYDIIPTGSTTQTITFEDYQIRQSNEGALLEGASTNLINHSNDLASWTKTNCTVTQLLTADPFGNKSQNLKIVYGSLPNCSIEASTEVLSTGIEYNVSFYAYLTAGSMESFSVEIGGGAVVELAIPPVTGFQRFSVKATSGALDTIKFNLLSPSLTAQLALSSLQIETGDLTSYIPACGASSGSRDIDIFNFDYAYNFPAPNLPFSLSYKIKNLPIGGTKKYVFSNGLSTTNEFSLYYENTNLVMNNGGNLASVEMTSYSQVGLVYDGTDLKFYGERALINTVTLASTSTIGTTVYLGYNGTGNHINAYLSNVLAYNTALSHNNMLYLQGL